MAVPRKRISTSRKRKNIWKKKGYWTALKAFSLGKSLNRDPLVATDWGFEEKQTRVHFSFAIKIDI